MTRVRRRECFVEKLRGLKVAGRSLAQDVQRGSALPASCFLHKQFARVITFLPQRPFISSHGELILHLFTQQTQWWVILEGTTLQSIFISRFKYLRFYVRSQLSSKEMNHILFTQLPCQKSKIITHLKLLLMHREALHVFIWKKKKS